MPRFRVLIQGESADPEADWFGFYATRDHDANSEADAETIAIRAIREDWTRGGGLRLTRALACWRPMPWQPQMKAGCSFYTNFAEAQAKALSIETEAANAPSEVRALKP